MESNYLENIRDKPRKAKSRKKNRVKKGTRTKSKPRGKRGPNTSKTEESILYKSRIEQDSAAKKIQSLIRGEQTRKRHPPREVPMDNQLIERVILRNTMGDDVETLRGDLERLKERGARFEGMSPSDEEN